MNEYIENGIRYSPRQEKTAVDTAQTVVDRGLSFLIFFPEI